MKYCYSQIDKKNIQWFSNDVTCASFHSLELHAGNIRGLTPFKMIFEYPISVIAGRNCSGKSTILALIACAYHNKTSGFKPAQRKYPYYTFSDFFVQSNEEIRPEGIIIGYAFLHDNWRPTKDMPDGVGFGYQYRKKRKGGKWNNYSLRIGRNVIFFGIERVVPHSEKSVSKSYRAFFARTAEEGWEQRVRKVVGKILGQNYDDFWFASAAKYRLPLVSSKKSIYSGFNMGAGENALFEIFSTIFSCPRGALFIMDEIELGLHEDAQKRLIRELKEICNKRHIQIICTTHAPAIINAIPLEGRFFIEKRKGKTILTPKINAKFAASKLAGIGSDELDIFMEDGISLHLLTATLSAETRKRTNISPIGSAAAIMRQLAAGFKDQKTSESLAILDGDQSQSKENNIKTFLAALETTKNREEALQWISDRIGFLPGETYPEKWMLEKLQETNAASSIAERFRISPEELEEILELANQEEKHNELYRLSEELALQPEQVLVPICEWIAENYQDEFTQIIESISILLE